MLLNDIGRVPTTTLKKINQYLGTNYGFTITEGAKEAELVSIMETIENEIANLKMQGSDAKVSPEISKRLLILEGVKTLREFAVATQLQSPDLEPLVAALTNAVVDHFRKCGTHDGHLEDAIAKAMEEYRGSEYLFPDDYIESRLRNGAHQQLMQPQPSIQGDVPQETGEMTFTDDPLMVGESAETDEELDEDYETKERPLTREEYQSKKRELQRIQLDADTSKSPVLKRQLMISLAQLNKRAAAAGLLPTEESKDIPETQGIEMREHKNFVRHLRTLLETEVSQAEVMMAAKGFAQELQEMVEKIGRLQNEDLPPVTDQMRETYGTDSASAFQTQIYGALQGVMDSLYTAKNQVDDAVSNMATTGQIGAETDMDKSIGGDMGADVGVGDEGGMDAGTGDLDLDNIGDEMAGDEVGDEFGGAETEEPLGREMKEAAKLKKKIAEMKSIVARARKLKESRK